MTNRLPNPTSAKVYEIIVRRFLAVFYPAAVYQKISLTVALKDEKFFAGFKVLVQEGYLKVTEYSFAKKKEEKPQGSTAGERVGTEEKENAENGGGQEEGTADTKDPEFIAMVQRLRKGDVLALKRLDIREGETTPPKRYNSGTMILTMENAGQFIEDDELRAQIKGSGIGTSATRAEILKKLVNIQYLALNKKTQVITPTLMGEMVYEVVAGAIKPLLDPALTASWEKGLTLVAEGSITEDEYMRKLDDFVTRRTNIVKQLGNQTFLFRQFDHAAENYKGGRK